MKYIQTNSIKNRGIFYQRTSLNHLKGISSINETEPIDTIFPNWQRTYGFIYKANRGDISRNHILSRETEERGNSSITGYRLQKRFTFSRVKKNSIENFWKYNCKKLHKRKGE